ncbi:MAG: ThiF family adenylyltransferase [Candidatus Saccharibacteria bacterium]
MAVKVFIQPVSWEATVSSDARFERNLGFMSQVEQGQLENATVSIAGVGGDGALLAVELARMGVGSFKLADPDPFEIENTNRQATCVTQTLGINKAVAVGDYLTSINPNITIEIYKEGITADNAAEFVKGSTLVIDETEFTLHALGIMVAREARRHNIPVLTALNIGFGAIVTTYHPEGKPLERQLGFSEHDSIEDIAQQEVKIDRWLPYIPKYGDMNVLAKVASGEKSAPSIAPGVALAAAAASSQAFLNIVGRNNNRPKPVFAPKALIIDVMSMEMKQIKFNRTSHYRHLARMLLANTLKNNPKADY